jgi:hypothetical protein
MSDGTLSTPIHELMDARSFFGGGALENSSAYMYFDHGLSPGNGREFYPSVRTWQSLFGPFFANKRFEAIYS